MTSGGMRPYYVQVGDEEQVFTAAFRQGMALVLKGPTGCGKTRFVEAMAHELDRPLVTIRRPKARTFMLLEAGFSPVHAMLLRHRYCSLAAQHGVSHNDNSPTYRRHVRNSGAAP